VAKANHITAILNDGTQAPASVIRFISNLDLALLKIEPPFDLVPIIIADSDSVPLSADIITVGNSEMLSKTISGGRIVGIGTNRELNKQGKRRVDLFQTDINLYKGDSGGPLFDKKGQLIGLMTAQESGGEHTSFAIPSNKIMKYLLEYLNPT